MDGLRLQRPVGGLPVTPAGISYRVLRRFAPYQTGRLPCLDAPHFRKYSSGEDGRPESAINTTSRPSFTSPSEREAGWGARVPSRLRAALGRRRTSTLVQSRTCVQRSRKSLHKRSGQTPSKDWPIARGRATSSQVALRAASITEWVVNDSRDNSLNWRSSWASGSFSSC
jgi:hypothetical protein